MAEPLILVGTTLSPASDAVVRTGAALARASARDSAERLVLVHVLAFPQPLARLLGAGTPGAGAMQELHDRAQARLEAQADRLGVASSSLTATEVVTGSPHRVLAEAAERHHAELLVVGASEDGTHLTRPLGSTAERVVRLAHCPVWVVRGERESPIPPRRVVVAVDFSARSVTAFADALGWLARWAGEDEPAPQVTALFVLSPFETAVGEIEVDYDSAEAVARDELERLAERHGQGLDVTPTVRRGSPAAGILAEAAEREADLVVVSTHGFGGRERLLLGSVAERVVREAPVSVLVLPPETGEGDGAAAPT